MRKSEEARKKEEEWWVRMRGLHTKAKSPDCDAEDNSSHDEAIEEDEYVLRQKRRRMV